MPEAGLKTITASTLLFVLDDELFVDEFHREEFTTRLFLHEVDTREPTHPDAFQEDKVFQSHPLVFVGAIAEGC